MLLTLGIQKPRYGGYSKFSSCSTLVVWLQILFFTLSSTPVKLRGPLESMPQLFLFPAPGCHDRAVLLYEYVGKRIVDLQHTEVPDAYRGRGIAKHLAKV